MSITLGIVSPSPATADLLRTQTAATGLAVVKIEIDEYCIAAGDRSARRLLEAAPDILIVDVQEKSPALHTLEVLHSALPETWLFVTAEAGHAEIIIETMRAGAREFLPQPVTSTSLQQAIRRYIAEKQKSRQSQTCGEIYCITSAKCGAGTTSVAINAATAAASLPDTRVGLLDLNNTFGDVAAFLNIKPKFTIEDALSASTRLDSVLLDSYTAAAHGVAILPGMRDFDPGRAMPVAELGHVLEVAAGTYSHCFLDFPISSTRECLRLVTDLSKAIVVIVTPDLPAIWRTNRLIRFLKDNDCAEKVRLILNRSSKGNEIRDTEIQEAVSHPVFWKLPNDDAASMDAAKSGKPVAAAETSELARSYREFARELTGIAPPEKRRSLLKLFS